MSWLLLAVPAAALTLAAGLVPALRDWRRRRAVAAGTTSHDVVVLGLPEAVGATRLRVGATSVVVDDPESRRRYDLTPTGLTLDRQYGDWSRGGERERTATGRDGRGNLVEVTGPHTDMLALWDALHDRPLPAAPRPPVAAPTGDALVGSAFVAAAGLGALLLIAVVAGATPVDGTVVDPGSGDEQCLVEWTSPWDDRTVRNGVDCSEDVGAVVPLWALGTPLRGEVWDAETPAGLSFCAVLGVLLGIATRAWSTWSGRRHARRAAAQTAEALEARRVAEQDERGSVPPLGVELPPADGLTYATARALQAEVTRARAQRTWTTEDLEEYRQLRRSVARLELLVRALRLAPAVVAPIGVLILGAALAWTSVDGLLVGQGPSATTEATVGDVVEGRFLLWPETVELTFTTATGQEVAALAAVVDADALAATAAVEYSVGKPFRVRVVGDPGPARGVALSGAAVLVSLVVSVTLTLLGPLRRRRALARADRSGPAHLAYVLDRVPVPPGEVVPDADATVLLFDERGAPAFQLLVTGEGVVRAGESGTARIRGELREGAPVRCTLGDVDVRCPGELLYLDPQEWLDDLREEFDEEPVR